VRLERLEPGAGQPALGAIFGIALAAGAGLAATWLRLGLPTPFCHFHAWTGIPCPGCGTTRLIAALLSGDVLVAMGYNPLVFAALCAVALWAVVSAASLALGLPPRRVVLAPAESAAARVGAVVLLLAGWSYLLWRGV